MDGNNVAQIIIGVLTLAGVIITCIYNNRKTANDFKLSQEIFNVRLQEQMNAQNQLMNMKLQDLTAEVREHNNFAKRMPVVEQQFVDLRRRVEEIEKKVSK